VHRVNQFHVKHFWPTARSRSLMHASLWALLLCANAAKLSAQNTPPQKTGCFATHVRLNGKPVEGPRTITLKSKLNESTVTLDGGCFMLPLTLLTEKEVDVFFPVTGNKIWLSGIVPGFFAGPWDIDLEDKRFGKTIVLPKHTRISEACLVVFHAGEPETVILQTECRTSVPPE
jgi:hypothetical protein